MTRPVDLQFYAFFVMVLAGVALGLGYDTYRAFRTFCRPLGLIGAAADLIFGLWALFLLGLALLLGNWGDLRVYVVVGVGIGLAFYHYFGRRPYQRAARWVAGLLVTATRKTRRAVVAWSATAGKAGLSAVRKLRRRVWPRWPPTSG
ncbi:MAG: spore cortex biosynthesis protein YabQ [Actinobacteria bacterium]|nr:spore cortex biosynthesis protein YabQ [Actinomycetota bacterium]